MANPSSEGLRMNSGIAPSTVLACLAMFNLENFTPSVLRLTIMLVSFTLVAAAAELPSKKYLDLKAIKTMVAAAEAEAERQHVSVTICIVDESGNLLFFEKGETASLNTINWAQLKARSLLTGNSSAAFPRAARSRRLTKPSLRRDWMRCLRSNV